MGKGARYERKLSNKFQDAGWYSMTSGSSGSGTTADRPDLIAARDGHIIVAELKFTSGDTVYEDAEKIEALKRVGDDFDAQVYFVARFSGDTTFYGFPPDLATRTGDGSDGSSYKITKDLVDESDNWIELPPTNDDQ